MVKLENLNLNENLLAKLPATILKLKNLKKIHLNKNKFKIIPNELFQLKLLDHVDLSSNSITSIDDSVLTFDCIELNLNENQIKFISNNISKCQRLKVLRLDQNLLELKSIPKSLLEDSNVSLLAFDGNLFTQKQFQEVDGYEKYMDRYTATKRKFD
jgi:Leucine-rich repeat (LRR) protein